MALSTLIVPLLSNRGDKWRKNSSKKQSLPVTKTWPRTIASNKANLGKQKGLEQICEMGLCLSTFLFEPLTPRKHSSPFFPTLGKRAGRQRRIATIFSSLTYSQTRGGSPRQTDVAESTVLTAAVIPRAEQGVTCTRARCKPFFSSSGGNPQRGSHFCLDRALPH